MAPRAPVALSVSEILHLIIAFSIGDIRTIKFLGRSMRAYRIARVSRDFFQAAIPFVWEEIDAENLMHLIPVVKECLKGKLTPDDGFKANLEKYNLNNWTDAQLSRLHFYGPFVKRLSHFWVHRDHISLKLFETQIGSRILEYMATHVILPNLRELSSEMGDKSSLLDWRLSLVSPSLKRYDVGRGQKEFPFVETVIKRCPGLETLHLYGHYNHAERPGPKPVIFSQLSLPLALHELWTDARFVCHDMLVWASKLPLLQSLRITDTYENPGDVLSSLIPVEPYSFVALTVLNLDWDPRVITLLRICRFPNLTALYLDFDSHDDKFSEPDLCLFASLIVQDCPMITKLSVRLFTDYDSECGLVEWLGVFRPLRLSQLRVSIEFLEESDFNALNERIAGYWPNLERLVWDEQYMSLQMVANTIVLFPSLSLLIFDTLYRPWSQPGGSVSSISTDPLVLVCYIASRDKMTADSVTNLLSHLRPKIRCDIYLKASSRSSSPSGSSSRAASSPSPSPSKSSLF